MPDSNEILNYLRNLPDTPPPPLQPSQVEIVEVSAPIVTDERGITWAGNIGITRYGLFFDKSLTVEEWGEFHKVIKSVDSSKKIMAGDWAAHGVGAFELTYDQIAAAFGYKSGKVVETAASVCRNVPQLARANSTTFEHMRVVATLDFAAQKDWLEIAHNNGWSAAYLDAHLRSIGILEAKNSVKSGKRNAIKPIQLVNKVELRRARNTTPENRQKIIADLRKVIEELEAL